MIAERTDIASRETDFVPVGYPVHFPADLADWAGTGGLWRTVQGAAARACGDSWMNLVRDETVKDPADDLLLLVSYCYLQGIYHSIDVARRLDTDENLLSLRGQLGIRPEQIRRFRRDNRRALTDCITHSLISLWRQRHPTAPNPVAESGSSSLGRHLDFGLLEPFYLQAHDRLDRAVALDSMAMDY